MPSTVDHKDPPTGRTARDDRDYLLLCEMQGLREESRDSFRDLRDQGNAHGALLAELVALHKAEHEIRVEHFALQKRGLDASIAEQERRGAWLRGLLTPQNLLLLVIALSVLLGNGAGAGESIRVALGLPDATPATAVTAPAADAPSASSDE
ncbi:MAG: hypothetical protein QME96_06575 [Myxococcota bacterium]|nr:hypothetical protein [Myxococcota bacterium]